MVAEDSKDQNEKKEVTVPEKFKDVVKQIEEMSVLDLSELVKVLEDKFGVSAAPVAVAAAGAPAAGEAAAPAEKSSFNIELTSVGSQKVAVIKVVKEVAGVGLKEASDLIKQAPAVIKENVPKAEAEEIKKKLEEAGGSVELK